MMMVYESILPNLSLLGEFLISFFPIVHVSYFWNNSHFILDNLALIWKESKIHMFDLMNASNATFNIVQDLNKSSNNSIISDEWWEYE